MDARSLTECYGYTDTLDAVIVALCLDYDRRAAAVEKGAVSSRCGMEYKYLNYRIFEGAAEIVTERYARLYINEIGRKVGYALTEHPAISERKYKVEKREVKINIARKLHLIS